MLEQYQLPFIMTFLAGLATLIGGFITFVIKRDNMKAISLGLGFSAGVMIFLSFTEILEEANELLAKHFPHNFAWIAFGGFLAGIIVAILIDIFIPDHIDSDFLKAPENCSHKHKIKRAGFITAIAIALHNFPEGLATFIVSAQDITIGTSVALAIAIHNIPEGIAVAIPIYHATGKKRKAIWYSFWTGLTEPLGALIGLILINLFMPEMFVGFLLAAVAGIMVYISFDTLLPLSHECGDWHSAIKGIISGIIVIYLSLLLLGE